MVSLPKLKKWVVQEITEFLPWTFISYVAGILSYFVIYSWVNIYLLSSACLGAGIILFFVRKKDIWGWLISFIFFFLLGISNIAFHFNLKEHPVLTHPLYHERIEATIIENRALIDKQIVTLDKIRWQNPDLKMPQKIRVHFKNVEPLLKEGDRIKAFVHVFPPNGAQTSMLWFQKIGATGVMDQVVILEKAPEKAVSFFQTRQKINQYLFGILPRSQAEIMAPLITGEQKLVSQDTYQVYRKSGIAHVLSVSGFHMALLATFLFWLIRGTCSFFPRIVFYWNTKKIAAVAAMIGTFLYLGLSGFQIPAIRAFIMIAFVFAGILIDRSILSMRALILAGFGILLLFPYMLLSVSFQLSFTAVAVLVALCHVIQNQPWEKWMKVVVGFIGLNVLVFLVLSPFIAYHFHQFTPYGILGNMLFNSIFSFFIMPLLFLGTLLIPLGVGKLFFHVAGFGLDFVHWGAVKIANLPYSEVTFSDFSAWTLVFISFGIMLMCFMKTPLRQAGLIPIFIGILFMVFS